MIRIRSSFLHRRVVTPVLLVTWLTSCTAWRVREGPLPDIVREHEPTRIRVTLVSGERREFTNLVISGTTVRALWDRDGFVDPLVEIPLDSIATVEVRKTDVGATVALVAAIVAIPIVIGAIALSNADFGFGDASWGGGDMASCPVVYSWDGAEWRLDSGTFGGAIFRPLARTDLDNLDHATAIDGVLRLKLANELRETEHVDALSVVAVDHAPGVSVAPDGAGRAHGLARPRPPIDARDAEGRNVLASLAWSDGWTWESSLAPRDTADLASLRDGVELVFERPAGAAEARLVVDGHNTEWAAALVYAYVQLHGDEGPAWYAAMNEDAAGARAVGETFAQAGFLRAELWSGEAWVPQGLFWEAGPEVIKRQVMALDLSGVEGDRVRIRLSSIPSFWRLDRVALDVGPEPVFAVEEIPLRSALASDGRDVRAALAAVDGEEWVMRHGDVALLELDAPAVPDGLERTYLLRTHGWYQIDQTSSGPPVTELLRRIEAGPEGVARIAVVLRDEALRWASTGADAVIAPRGGR